MLHAINPLYSLSGLAVGTLVGFTGVGGSVQASLRRTYPPDKVANACGAAGVDRRAVVAFVTPDQWIEIFRVLDAAPRKS